MEYPDYLVEEATEMVKEIDGGICKDSYPPVEDLPTHEIDGEEWPVPPDGLKVCANGMGIDKRVMRYKEVDGQRGRLKVGAIVYPAQTFYSQKKGQIGYHEGGIVPSKMAQYRENARQRVIGNAIRDRFAQEGVFDDEEMALDKLIEMQMSGGHDSLYMLAYYLLDVALSDDTHEREQVRAITKLMDDLKVPEYIGDQLQQRGITIKQEISADGMTMDEMKDTLNTLRELREIKDRLKEDEVIEGDFS